MAKNAMRFVKEGLRKSEDPPQFFLGDVLWNRAALITKLPFLPLSMLALFAGSSLSR